MKDQPAPSYASRMEFAKTIGTVRPDKGRFMIDVCVNADCMPGILRPSPSSIASMISS